MLAQQRQRLAQREHRAEHVDRDRRLELVDGHVLEAADRAEDPGRTDETVQAAVAEQRSGVGPRLRIGDIERKRAVAVTGKRGRGLAHGVGPPRDDGDPRAVSGERLADRAADAHRASGDGDVPAGEAEIVGRAHGREACQFVGLPGALGRGG